MPHPQTTDPTVDTYDGNPGRLWGRVVPEADVDNSFTLHDDTVLAVTTTSAGDIELRYEPGTQYAGLRIQIHAPGVSQVELDSTAVTEAASEAELDTCQSCWYRDGDQPWIWLSLDPGQNAQHTFTLR